MSDIEAARAAAESRATELTAQLESNRASAQQASSSSKDELTKLQSTQREMEGKLASAERELAQIRTSSRNAGEKIISRAAANEQELYYLITLSVALRLAQSSNVNVLGIAALCALLYDSWQGICGEISAML